MEVEAFLSQLNPVLSFVEALGRFVRVYRLSGDLRTVDAQMALFAKHYCARNTHADRAIFINERAVYEFAFFVIMVATDLAVKNHWPVESFVRYANEHSNEQEYPRAWLEQIHGTRHDGRQEKSSVIKGTLCIVILARPALGVPTLARGRPCS